LKLDVDDYDADSLVTRAEVQKLVRAEIQKTREERRVSRERKPVTLDELSDELELDYDQKIKVQEIITENEEKMVKAVFGITDTDKMLLFKNQLANVEYDAELKKKLKEQARQGMFNARFTIMPVFRDARTQLREVLGDEKYNEYRSYEVKTNSEFAPALEIIRDVFSFGRRFQRQPGVR
jgi:hypothetical protein